MFKIIVAVIACIFCISGFETECVGEENIIIQGSDETGTFDSLVNSLTNENEINLDFKSISNVFIEQIKANRNAFSQVILITLISAVIKIIVPSMYSKEINSTSQMVVLMCLITVIFSVFVNVYHTTTNCLGALTNIYESVCPVFFPAVGALSGKIHAAAYYQMVLFGIEIVNRFFNGILIKMNYIFMLIGLMDCTNDEDRFGKMTGLIKSFIRMGCKAVLTIFLGLNGVKAILLSSKDTMKTSSLVKAVNMLPGIGNQTSVVTETLLQTGAVVKNTIGVAAIITVAAYILVPVLKLLTLQLIYQTLAAVLEPVADKKISRSIQVLSDSIINFEIIILVSAALFMIAIAVICVATRV